MCIILWIHTRRMVKLALMISTPEGAFYRLECKDRPHRRTRDCVLLCARVRLLSWRRRVPIALITLRLVDRMRGGVVTLVVTLRRDRITTGRDRVRTVSRCSQVFRRPKRAKRFVETIRVADECSVYNILNTLNRKTIDRFDDIIV